MARASNPIQFSRNRENPPRFEGPLTAGPIRPRAATADALRRPLLTRFRRRHADAPAAMPHLVQDDGRFRFTAKLFIVFHSAQVK
jgi:hypothetical protein